ncbi:MAG: AbgT family transporter [Prevotella sp.]|jgi:aminobenzoyl-glutamate transport protein|nr:AbgT family transporter [Prevotella sp.]MBQ9262172.1 AbgT family transporter [Prevotella sp.]
MKIDSSIFNKRFMAFTALVLLLAELVLILLSWILFAIGEEEVRSLLSSEGIRWFVGGFTTMVSSPLLVWLIILLMAFGAFQKSGLISLTDASYQMTYRDKTALRVAIVFLLAYIAVILLLTVIPHAILLSATGALFPSPFSRSIVPLTAFGIALVSIIYGIMSGRLRDIKDILDALSFGISKGAPVFVLYILIIQFVRSMLFVFS